MLHSPSNRTPKELAPLKLNKHIATTTTYYQTAPPPHFPMVFLQNHSKHLEFALAQLQQLWHLIEFDPWDQPPAVEKQSRSPTRGNEQQTKAERFVGNIFGRNAWSCENDVNLVRLHWHPGILWIAFKSVSHNLQRCSREAPGPAIPVKEAGFQKSRRIHLVWFEIEGISKSRGFLPCLNDTFSGVTCGVTAWRCSNLSRFYDDIPLEGAKEQEENCRLPFLGLISTTCFHETFILHHLTMA